MSYDPLNRLSSVKRADGSETQYEYDLRSNRLTQSDTRDLQEELKRRQPEKDHH
ncbi:hypothetical protein ACE3MZ_17440 [Paenibacillus sp. WLX1005]|uniref:hypothetical protein n=1 Tax=Paenibacillus sp. WLX1005 TaxID=3243766 RepID=UPI0039844ED0